MWSPLLTKASKAAFMAATPDDTAHALSPPSKQTKRKKVTNTYKQGSGAGTAATPDGAPTHCVYGLCLYGHALSVWTYMYLAHVYES